MTVIKDTGPIPTLKNYLLTAIKTKNWFNAVVFSAIQVERYGCDRVRLHLNSLKVEESLIEAMLDRVSLPTIAKYLKAIGDVDETEYKTIKKLNVARNNFVHRTAGSHYLVGTTANEIYEPIVKEAIRLLEEKLDARRLKHFQP
jgi:hypothetical protein